MEPIYSPTVERLYNSLPEVMRLADARYDYALKNYISSTGDILGDIEEIMARVEYLSANDRLGIEQEYEHTDWIPKTEYFWDGERNKSTSRAVNENGDVVTNLATNPSFEDTNGAVEVWRNLATNPSFEATGGTVEAYRNLATNPSFEATSGTVEVWRNLAQNPRGAVVGWWNGQLGGFFTPSTLNGRPAALVTRGGNNSPFVSPAVLETRGKIVYVRAVVSPTADTAGKKVGVFGYDGALVGPTVEVSMGAVGTETVINYISRRPVSGEADFRAYIGPSSGDTSWAEGQQLYVTDVVISTAPIPYYFDGSYSPDPDLTPSWTGAVNNSISIVTGARVARTAFSSTSCVGVQSSQWGKDGGNSVRLVPKGVTNDTSVSVAETSGSPTGTGMTLTPGKTYTALGTLRLNKPQTGDLNGHARTLQWVSNNVSGWAGAAGVKSSAAPNEPGEYDLRVTFTVPLDSVWCLLRIYNGASAGNGDVWWDNLMIVEGEYTGPYFDGNASPNPDLIPSWEGAVNASASLLTGTRASGTWVGWQSKQWAATGDFSHYIPQGSVQEYVIDAGKSFQIQPREVGQPYLVNGDPRTTTGQPINIIGPAMIETGQGWWDNLAIVEGKYTGPYFDGNTSSDPDLMPSWEGSVNNSTSILSGRKLGWVTNVDAINHRVYQSEVDGSNWLRITPIGTSSDTSAGVYGSASSLLMLPGKTYTALAKLRLDAPQTGTLNNVARSIVFASNSVAGWGGVTYASVKGENRTGVQELRLTFTVPADAVWSYIRLYNGASVGGGDVWWDNLMITEGPYIGPYFDGDTKPTYEVSPVDHKTSDLIDGRFADAKWLPWISQILGVQTGNITSDTDLRRRLVNSTAGLYAGTEESMLGAVKAVLSGGKNAVLRRGRTKTGVGSVWDILLITVDSETPIDFDFHSYLTRQGVKPAGVIIHQSTYAPTWETLNTERPIWEDWNDDTWQMIMETGI